MATTVPRHVQEIANKVESTIDELNKIKKKQEGLDEEHKLQNDALRERSGHHVSSNKLVCFLYELMRDHISPGQIETLVRNTSPDYGGEWVFTNGWLARYAEDLAKRLQEEFEV